MIYYHIKKCKGINPTKYKVLDVGVGDGELTFMLCKWGYNVSGIDISEGKIKRVRKNLDKFGLKAKLLVADIFDLHTTFNEHFDFIIISEVLEHLINPKHAVSEIKKLLNDDGVLIITVPYHEKIKYEVCIYCNKLTPRNGHLHSFDLEDIDNLLNEAGLDVVKNKLILNRIYSIGFIAKILNKIPYCLLIFIDNLTNKILKNNQLFEPQVILTVCKK